MSPLNMAETLIVERLRQGDPAIFEGVNWAVFAIKEGALILYFGEAWRVSRPR